MIDKKVAVQLTWSAPNFRGETVVVNNVTYPIYYVWRVSGTGVNATNILNKVLVATTTALTAIDTSNLKVGTYTYFVITQTPNNVSVMSNPKSTTIVK